MFVTASKVIPIVKSLLGWYATEGRKLPRPSFSHDFCDAILQSLYQRFQPVEDVKELSLATLCDPRYKKQGFRSGERASRAVGWLKESLTSDNSTLDPQPLASAQEQDTQDTFSLWSSFDKEVHATRSVENAGRDAALLEVTRQGNIYCVYSICDLYCKLRKLFLPPGTFSTQICQGKQIPWSGGARRARQTFQPCTR